MAKKRTYKSPPLSEGCRLLRELPQHLREIADAIGTPSQSTVSDYLHGRRTPGDEHRGALHRAYGIEVGRWDDPPLAAAPAEPAQPATMAEVLAQLANVKAAQADPSNGPSTRSRLAAEVRGLLRLRAHLEAQAPVNHDKLARSPEYQAIAAKLVGAVKDCEKCSAAVVSALGFSALGHA